MSARTLAKGEAELKARTATAATFAPLAEVGATARRLLDERGAAEGS